MEEPVGLKEVQPSSTAPLASSGKIAPLQICRSYAKHGVCALPGTCIYDHPPALAASGSAPSTPVNNESNLAPTQAWEAAGQYFEPVNEPSQEICQTWLQTGSCTYGACQFSHPPLPIQYAPKYSLANSPPLPLQSQYPQRSQPMHEPNRARSLSLPSQPASHHAQPLQQLTPLPQQLSQLPRIPQPQPSQAHPQPSLNLDNLPSTVDSQRPPSQQHQLQQRAHKSVPPPSHNNPLSGVDQAIQNSSNGHTPSTANKSAPKKLLCKNWNKGCKFGDACRFYHPKTETTFDHLFKQSPPPLRDEDDRYDMRYDDYADYDHEYYSSNPKALADIGPSPQDKLSSYQLQVMQQQLSQQPRSQLHQIPQHSSLVQPMQPIQLMQPQQLPYQQYPQVQIVQTPQYQYQTPYNFQVPLQAPIQPMMQLQPQVVTIPPQPSDLYAQPPMQTHVYQSHLHEIHVSHQPQEQLQQLQQQLLQQQIQQQQMQQQLQIQQQQLQQQIQQQLLQQQKQQQLLQQLPEQFQLVQLTDTSQEQAFPLQAQLSLAQPVMISLPLQPQPQPLPEQSATQPQPQEEETVPQQTQPVAPARPSKTHLGLPRTQLKYKPKQYKKQQQQQTSHESTSDNVILERKHDTQPPQQTSPTTERTVSNNEAKPNGEMNGNGNANGHYAPANGKKKQKKPKQPKIAAVEDGTQANSTSATEGEYQ